MRGQGAELRHTDGLHNIASQCSSSALHRRVAVSERCFQLPGLTRCPLHTTEHT